VQLRARRILLRRLDNVRAEFLILATAFNLRVLWLACPAGQPLEPIERSLVSHAVMAPRPVPIVEPDPSPRGSKTISSLATHPQGTITIPSIHDHRSETGSLPSLPV
jgi:hypothetical protein